MFIEDQDAFKSWLTTILKPMCDADPAALAKYIIALVKKDKSTSALRDSMVSQLEVFLQDETEKFVTLLFKTLESQEYLTPIIPSANPPNPHPMAGATAEATGASGAAVTSPAHPKQTGVAGSSSAAGGVAGGSVVGTSSSTSSLTSNSHINNNSNSNGAKAPTVIVPVSELQSSLTETCNGSSAPSGNTAVVGRPSRSDRDDSRKDQKRSDSEREDRAGGGGRRRSRHRSLSRNRSRSRSWDRSVRRSRSPIITSSSASHHRDNHRGGSGRGPLISANSGIGGGGGGGGGSGAGGLIPSWRNKSPPQSSSLSSRRYGSDRRRGASQSPPPSRDRGRSRSRSPRHNYRGRYRNRSPPQRSPGGSRSRSRERSPARDGHSDIDARFGGNKISPKRRCRDYDEKGFCMRGEMCPYDHGVDPVVLEDSALSHVLAYAPNGVDTGGPGGGIASLPGGGGGGGGVGPQQLPPPEYNPQAPQIWRSAVAGPPPPPGVGVVVGPAHLQPPPNLLGGPPPLHQQHPGAHHMSLRGPPPPHHLASRLGYAGPPMLVGAPGPGVGMPPNVGLGPQRELIPIPVVDQKATLPPGTGGDPNNPHHHHQQPPHHHHHHPQIYGSRPPMPPGQGGGPGMIRGGMPPGGGGSMYNKRKMFDYNRLGAKWNGLNANGGPGGGGGNCSLELKKVPPALNNILHLNNHFSKFGRIVNIQVVANGDPEAAVVTFSSHVEATAAYRCPDAVLNNRFIRVFWHANNSDAGGAPLSVSDKSPAVVSNVSNNNSSSSSSSNGAGAASAAKMPVKARLGIPASVSTNSMTTFTASVTAAANTVPPSTTNSNSTFNNHHHHQHFAIPATTNNPLRVRVTASSLVNHHPPPTPNTQSIPPSIKQQQQPQQLPLSLANAKTNVSATVATADAVLLPLGKQQQAANIATDGATSTLQQGNNSGVGEKENNSEAAATPASMGGSTAPFGGGGSATVVDAQELKQQQVAVIKRGQELLATAVGLKKNKDEKRREALKLTQDLRKRKQELLEKQLAQQKLLIDKMDKTPAGPQRDKLLQTIKKSQEAIEAIRKDVAAQSTPTALAAAKAQLQQQQLTVAVVAKTKEEVQKEVLDAELDLMTKQQEGADPAEIKRSMLELRAKQRALALASRRPANAGGALGAAALVAKQRYGHPVVPSRSLLTKNNRVNDGMKSVSGTKGTSATMLQNNYPTKQTTVDHRPTQVLVSGYENDEADSVLAYFRQFGEIADYVLDPSTPSLVFHYRSRKDAEQAMLRGKHFQDRTLSVTWYTPAQQTWSQGQRRNSRSVLISTSESESGGVASNPFHSSIASPAYRPGGCSPRSPAYRPSSCSPRSPEITAYDDNILGTSLIDADDDLANEMSEEVLLQDDEEEDDESEDRSWRR